MRTPVADGIAVIPGQEQPFDLTKATYLLYRLGADFVVYEYSLTADIVSTRLSHVNLLSVFDGASGTESKVTVSRNSGHVVYRLEKEKGGDR